MKFLRPGITENQVTAHLMQYLYNIPGMEDVEDVIVSSGPNTWPNWRNFTDLLKLMLGVLASLFRSRAKLEAENLVLPQKINVLLLRMPERPDLNNTD